MTNYELARERAEAEPLRHVSDEDLVRVVLGVDVRLPLPVDALARSSAPEVAELLGISQSRAARLVTAFELGRRGAWAPPRRGERILDPAAVFELMRPAAHAERECFHVVMLDVRGRLIRTEQVAEGSLTQCPVSPRDALRPAVREGAHGIILCHNHPSGDPSPSFEDADLTERLRAAAELVGLVARDHVIVATGGYYSFVEAGRWRR
jgi:DNA repair protein RadC